MENVDGLEVGHASDTFTEKKLVVFVGPAYLFVDIIPTISAANYIQMLTRSAFGALRESGIFHKWEIVQLQFQKYEMDDMSSETNKVARITYNLPSRKS